MKIYTKPILIMALFYLCLIYASKAQTPTDEILMRKGEVCFALMYENGTWDQYWEGTYLRGNGNIGTLTRQMLMPMVAVGLTDKINFIASVPYIKTHSSGGTLKGSEGIQDLNLSLKIEWLKKRFGNGNFSFLTNTSFGTPLGNYLSDYVPYSIGFGASELGFRGIFSYRMDKGFVIRSSIAYLHRGQTEIERDYYYQDGSNYSSFMNVPNALNFSLASGYWLMSNQLRLELSYTTLRCLTGDDIRTYNAGQPSNKVELDQIGGFAQYYINGRQGLGVLAYYNQIIKGRNMGKFSTVGIGLTYPFQINNK